MAFEAVDFETKADVRACFQGGCASLSWSFMEWAVLISAKTAKCTDVRGDMGFAQSLQPRNVTAYVARGSCHVCRYLNPTCKP